MLLRPLLRPLLLPLLRSPLEVNWLGDVDADAAAWASAVTAAGGTYSATTLAAMSTFAKDAKAAGYWDKLNRINLFAGDQLAAALVPLKAGGGNATDTNVNFVSGDYTEATGLTGNGSTKKLQTGLIPSVSLTLNNTHLAVYNRAAAVAGGNCHIGCDQVGGRFSLFAPYSDATAIGMAYNSTGLVSAALTAPFGLMVSSRTTSTAHAVYENAVSVASSGAASSGALPLVELFVFAENNNGAGGSFFTAHPLGGYSIGSGLSAADVTAYNTHMEAFQDALGRGVQ